MGQPRKIIAIDAETDPFQEGRVPEPFIWGSYDGTDFRTFDSGLDLLTTFFGDHCYLFAHNGGKFDFHFLLKYIKETRVRLINSRIVEMDIGNAKLRDSFSIIPEPLSAYKKTDIEYWKLEKEHRKEHRTEIIEYLRTDCVYLWELVDGFFRVAGRQATIAANALSYARKLGIDPGRTNHRFDTEFRQFYFGGRVEARIPGKHKNINVFDINSSYAYAMLHHHASGPDYFVDDKTGPYTTEQIQRSFIDITCFSRGAFPLVDKLGMRFPQCLARFRITGWEYLTAKKHDLISHEKINRILLLPRTITFASYVEDWHQKKQQAEIDGDTLQRLIAKRMLNSLYGKMAQNPVNYFDYKIVPGGTEIDYEHGWQLGAEFDNKEIHERPVLWRYQNKWGEEWQKFPIHYNVATGASITGFARARLLDAIHTVGRSQVCYCDTDCIFTMDGANTFALKQDGELGSWVWEGLADPCCIAGKKLYGLKYVNGPNTGKEKLAHKGAKLTLDQIGRLCDGEVIEWRNKAPTFTLGKAPSFVVRSIRATALPNN